ncbi:hypothetical protein RUM44_006112 [Polyplax serrata]|uniref:Exonuclease 1 n=1 Tax=Polyplax serrata TaxID=468196 RepID=A0ABR1AZ01_POLSC
MGIQGLLPFLANSMRDAHISEFENQYVAVDAYCWLHKGIYSCSYELAMKKPTTKYVTYCMRYIEMLRHFKVKPILVFDGRNLSSKRETEKKRREERARKYKRGLELIRAGKTSEGRQLLGESVDVGHELVINLMKECRKLNVDCIVAPYEADAQLSYLSLQKIVACVVTEDSDLLVYGCEKVMFKMDKSGRGRLVEKSNIYMSLGMEAEEFTGDKFRHMCILSGCDYLPSLPSVGPATALKFIKLICDKDILEVLPKLPAILNKTKITVSQEYIDGFKIADFTFKHQLVYDPFQRKQVPLSPVIKDDEIIGEKLPDDEAFQLAIGNIDPISMKILGNFDPDKNGRGFDILWRKNSSKDVDRQEDIWNSSQTQYGKRQSEVSLVRNNLKKYCMSQATFTNNNVQRRQSAPEVARTGFLFERVKTPKPVESSNLLISRYFGSVKNKKGHDTKKTFDKGKRKGESFEEYLQRLYEEQVSDDENEEDSGLEDSNGGDSILDWKCSGKSIEANETSQRSSNQINEFKGHKEVKKEEMVVCHSLLDEISKVEKSTASAEEFASSVSDENLKLEECDIFVQQIDGFLKELSPMQKLCLNSPVQLTNGDNKSGFVETEGKVMKDEEINVTQTSTSPVFKVRGSGSCKRNRSTDESIPLDKLTNTAGTSTSLYFSPDYSGSTNKNLQKTPVSSKLKTVKPNKTACKNQSSRTLFQFGFKKENKEVDAT